jgi:hydroxymethylbilane synthase
MSAGVLRVGTRGSALALWQTEHVRARLAEAGHSTEPVPIRTTGDVIQDVPLAQIGSRALFTKQIDEAMLAGRIDLAVHSLKDLPTALPEGIALVAVGERHDPRDALVGRGPLLWQDLPQGAVIATSSLRRRAQLLLLRPDLQVRDIRGNVDTLLAKLDAAPEWTAIVLAAAGLLRLGLEARISQRLPTDVMLPAPGQGALAVTARAEDRRAKDAAAALHHPPTALAVAAERAFLRALEGGCQVPIGAHAEIGQGDEIHLRGRVVSLGGERGFDGAETGVAGDERDASAVGETLAARLIADGAGALLADLRAESAPLVAEP